MTLRFASSASMPLLAALLFTTPGAAQATAPDGSRGTARDDQFRSARVVINRLITEERVPSVVVAVARDGEILWEEGFGWADRERRIPATPHTPYSLASTTKPITTTAVMALSEKGKINLDAPVEEYLGRLRLTGLAGDTREATVRRTMAHSAGLPTHYYFYHGGYGPASVEETLTRYGILVYPPGTQFQYSNVGYRAIDVAISNASGQTYAEFLRKEVFLPLGMTRSAVGVDPVWAGEAAARYDLSQKPIPMYMTDTPGSGDVWASAHDMLRFGMFHLGTLLPGQERILSPESVRAMQRVASAPGSEYGLGWMPGTDRGHRVVRHGGNMPGVHSQFVLYPDENIVVVVIANQNRHPQMLKVTEAIAAALLPRPRGDSAPSPAPAARGESAAEARARFAGRWVGSVITYEDTIPFHLEFQPDGDVHAKLGSASTTLVNRLEVNGARLEGWMHGTMPTADARRHRPHILLLNLNRDGEELVGQIVAETSLDPGFFALSSFVRLAREPAGGTP